MSVYSMGFSVRLQASEKYVEEARLIEYRHGKKYALVEWRGAFCEVLASRILPENAGERAARVLQNDV